MVSELGVRYSLNELRHMIHLSSSPKRKSVVKRNTSFRSEFSAEAGFHDGSSSSASSSFTQTGKA